MKNKETGHIKEGTTKTLGDFIRPMENKRAGRIKEVTTKTLGDFIRLEEGSTGKQSALKTGAMVGGSVLAQVLFSALDSAEAYTHSAGNIDSLTHGSRTILWGVYHGSAL